MIKRPLIWLLISYLIGLIGSNQKIPSWFLFFTLGLLSMILSVWIKKNQFYILLIMPIVMLIGYFNLYMAEKETELDILFNKKIEVKAKGIVKQITEKESVQSVIIEDVVIELESNTLTTVINQTKEKETLYYLEKILLYIPKESIPILKIGNHIQVQGNLQKFQSPSNLGQFNEKQYYQSKRISYKLYTEEVEVLNTNIDFFNQMLFNLKKALVYVYNTCFNQKDKGIISAMITGEQSLLNIEVKELYQKNGISHILAISGLHISIVGMYLFLIFQKLGFHNTISTIITIFLVLCYGILTGFSISTSRAIIMLALSLGAKVIGRTYDGKTAVSFSAWILLLQSPLQLFQAGFLLSFGAIIGILYLYPVLEERILMQWKVKLEEYKKLQESSLQKETIWNQIKENIMEIGINWIAPFFFSSLSIQIITLPIIAWFYYEIPMYAIILNLIILPFISIVIILSMIGGLLGILYLPISIFLLGGVHYILSFYESVCNLFLRLPGSSQLVGRPEIWKIFVYYSIIIIWVVSGSKFLLQKKYIKNFNIKIYHIVRIGVVSVLFIILFITNKKQLEIYVLDVGQGDGIFIKYGKENVLIDGGSTDVKQVGMYRMLPMLKAKGISTITYAIVTHTDYDHVSGLIELLKAEEKIEIKYLILPETNFQEESYKEIVQLGIESGVKIYYIKRGDNLYLGNNKNKVNIRCIHPDISYMASSKNGYSTVLSLTYGSFSMLLTGDLEADGETWIQENEEVLSCNVLKIAHHGSKYSTSLDWLEKTLPEISIISCGLDNRYGHPHKEVIERLNQIKSKIFITKEMGAITIKTNGKQMSIKGYRK